MKKDLESVDTKCFPSLPYQDIEQLVESTRLEHKRDNGSGNSLALIKAVTYARHYTKTASRVQCCLEELPEKYEALQYLLASESLPIVESMPLMVCIIAVTLMVLCSSCHFFLTSTFSKLAMLGPFARACFHDLSHSYFHPRHFLLRPFTVVYYPNLLGFVTFSLF